MFFLQESTVSYKSSLTVPTSLVAPRSSVRDSVLETSMMLSPRFGHSAPMHDFVCFNRSRANSGSQEWQYPRSNLVYLRELGEGQFGKVLLMKAQVLTLFIFNHGVVHGVYLCGIKLSVAIIASLKTTVFAVQFTIHFSECFLFFFLSVCCVTNCMSVYSMEEIFAYLYII